MAQLGSETTTNTPLGVVWVRVWELAILTLQDSENSAAVTAWNGDEVVRHLGDRPLLVEPCFKLYYSIKMINDHEYNFFFTFFCNFFFTFPFLLFFFVFYSKAASVCLVYFKTLVINKEGSINVV